MTYSALTAISTFDTAEFPDTVPVDDESELKRWVEIHGLGEVIPDNDNYDAGNLSIRIDEL